MASALALLLLVVAVAAAAPRAGSVDDPLDGPPPYGAITFPDARSVAVSYEPGDGSLVVTLGLAEPLGTTLSPSASTWVDLTFGIGAVDAAGACAVPDLALEGREGDLRFTGNIDSTGPPEGVTDLFRTTVQAVGGPQIVGASGSISDDRRVITWTVAADPALAGRDLDCVGDVAMPFSPSDADAIAGFPLAGPDAPPPPAPAPPTSAGPATSPPAVVVATPPDLTAPRLRLSARARSVRALRANGLTARVSCDERCTVRARLRVRPRVARALGVSRMVGASPARVASGGRATMRIALTRAARRALAGRSGLRAVLELTATDPSGNRRTMRRSLPFGR